jgi:hypothetical protein
MIGRIIALVLLACSAHAQSVFVRTNEITGVSGPSEALAGVVGQYRFTLYAENGGEPATNVVNARFYIIDTYDGAYVVSNTPTSLGGAAFRGTGTLAARSDPSMTGFPYHVQFYNLDGDAPMYWAELVVTSAPAAQVSVTSNPVFTNTQVTVDLLNITAYNVTATQGTFGNLIVGTLDVTNQINAIDTNAVRRHGDTMTGALTNEAGFFGNGAGLTNLPPSTVASLDDIGDVSVAGAIAGEILSYDGTVWTNAPNAGGGVSGTVQLYTNASGVIGWTNSAGYFEAIARDVPIYGASFHDSFDSDTITSNLNAAAVPYWVTNGSLVITLPNETANPRLFGFRPCATGTWTRAAFRIKQAPSRNASQLSIYGIGWQRNDGSNYIWGIRQQNIGPYFTLIEANASYSITAYPAGAAPYNHAAGTYYLHYYGLVGNDVIIAVDYDGTNRVRGFYGQSTEALNMYMLLTNSIAELSGIRGFGISQFSTSGTSGLTNHFGVYDDMQVDNGRLWMDPTP